MRDFLETQRLVLRRFTEADADNLLDLHGEPDVMRFITGKPTPRGVIRDGVSGRSSLSTPRSRKNRATPSGMTLDSSRSLTSCRISLAGRSAIILPSRRTTMRSASRVSSARSRRRSGLHRPYF